MPRGFIACFCVTICLLTGCDQSPPPPAPPAPIDPTPTKPDEPKIDTGTSSRAIALPDTLANVAPADKVNAQPSTASTTKVDNTTESDAPQYTIAEQHKAIVEQTVVAIRLNTAVLRTIVDEASAREAAPKLAAARAQLEKTSQQAQNLGAVPRHANALLTTPLGQQVLEATNEMTAELARIDDNKALAESLRRAMKQVSP